MTKKIFMESIKNNLIRYIIVLCSIIVMTLLISLFAPFLVKTLIDTNTLATKQSFVVCNDNCIDNNYLTFNNVNYTFTSNESEDSIYLTREGNTYKFDGVILNSVQVKIFTQFIFLNTLKIMGLFFIIFIIVAALSFVSDWNIRIIARKTILEMRKDVTDVLLKLDVSYFDLHPDGEIITKLVNDTEIFYRLLTEVATVSINTIIVYFSITITMLFINIYLFIIALAIIPLGLIWSKLYRNRVIKYFEAERDSLSKMNNLTNEQIQGIELIKTYEYEKTAQNRYHEHVKTYFNNARQSLLAEATISWTLVTVLQRSFILLLILFFGLSYFNNALLVSAGFIFLLINFVNSITHPLIDIIHMMNNYNEINVSLHRVVNFLQIPIPKDSDESLVVSKGYIELRDVYFSYNRNQPILNKLNLTFKPNQKTAIVGRTGSGKSTIINLLMRYYTNYQGEILIDDCEISSFSKFSLRENIGIVLQKTYLFEGTIFDNIVLKNNYSIDDVYNLVKLAKVDFILNHPDGLLQKIDENTSNFSLGQKQIIAFLRALIASPKILIFDEASSNLDMESERAINNIIDLYSKQSTIIIIAHRIATIASCDTIHVIHDGKLIETGSHSDLMSLKGKYYHNVISLK